MHAFFSYFIIIFKLHTFLLATVAQLMHLFQHSTASDCSQYENAHSHGSEYIFSIMGVCTALLTINYINVQFKHILIIFYSGW